MISDSENCVDLESEHLELALEREVSGIVIVASGESTPAIERAISRGIPVVLLDRTVEGVVASSVVSDNYQGANQATKYLLRLGHTRILFIAGGTGRSSAQERLAGFRDAMHASGHSVCDRYILNAEYDFENAADEVKRALKDDTPFSAVFASADVMAFGAKRALEQHGFSIPADVSLVGYDDIPLASSIGLTTVAQPAFELGREAITALIHTIEGRVTRVTASVLQPRLVIRDTCSRPA
jgi:LacI family transcriptional regulator